MKYTVCNWFLHRNQSFLHIANITSECSNLHKANISPSSDVHSQREIQVKLLPVFGWSPKLVNEYKKDFMNHPPKNGQNILYDFPGHGMVFSKYNQ